MEWVKVPEIMILVSVKKLVKVNCCYGLVLEGKYSEKASEEANKL